MKQVDETSQPQERETPFQYALPAVSRLAVLIGVLASGVLYALLPEHITIGPSWLLLVIEFVVMLPVTAMWLLRRPLPYNLTRKLLIGMLSLVTVALIVGVTLFIITLPQRSQAQATGLLRTAALLYVFNILLFGLWYWELDGGGPRERHLAGHLAVDFMFPQQVDGEPGNWKPHLLDYIFVAFTTATAFSPTDTYPLTHLAKGLMVLESVIALAIVVLLIGRGVNIL